MTLLAIFLKPFIAPYVTFAVRLPARLLAVAVYKWLPNGKIKKLLFTRI